MMLHSEFRRLIDGVLAGFCALLLLTGAAYAQTVEKRVTQLRPFSADQTRTMGSKTTTGKVYFTQNAMRVESVSGKGNQTIQIMRFDRKVMWNLIPRKRPTSRCHGPAWANLRVGPDQQGVQRELLGSEQVGEYHCENFRVHVTLEGKIYTSLEWDAKELDGLPVKSQDEKGTWSTEYRNVRPAPQDPSLFEIPSDYRKLSLFGNR